MDNTSKRILMPPAPHRRFNFREYAQSVGPSRFSESGIVLGLRGEAPSYHRLRGLTSVAPKPELDLGRAFRVGLEFDR